MGGAGDRLTDTVDLWSPEYRTDEYLRAAVRSLREDFGDPEQPMAMYQVEATDPRSSLGRTIELERFADSFDNDADMLRALYSRFEDEGDTDMLIVVDHREERAAGAIRVVHGSESCGTPMLNDLQRTGENGWGLSWEQVEDRSDFAARRPEEIIDIATLAVARSYTGSHLVDGVSKALFAAVLQHAIRSDAHTWVTLLDRVPYMLVQAWGLGVMQEFRDVPSLAYHGADDTTPLWCNFRPYERELLAQDEDRHARLMLNRGLDDYFFGWPDDRVIDLRDDARRPGQTDADVPADQDEATARR